MLWFFTIAEGPKFSPSDPDFFRARSFDSSHVRTFYILREGHWDFFYCFMLLELSRYSCAVALLKLLDHHAYTHIEVAFEGDQPFLPRQLRVAAR